MRSPLYLPPPPDLGVGDARSDWVRLRTLILLRWLAIIGQVAAILVSYFVFDIGLDLWACIAVVGAAVAVNLALMFGFPPNRRLTETEAMSTFLLDTGQLAALLALTGGLANPFALLVLAPVTIAASTLQTRATVFVGAVTITLVTLVAFFHRPMVLASGDILRAPPLFEFGYWLGIVVGVVFLGLYARRVSSEIHSMGDALLATQMALAREQKLTDLGGVVAAAAHELGTPLATIKLASTELAEVLADQPGLRADAELIVAQADRCRDILRSMGRAGKEDLQLRSVPLAAVIREAAEPHMERGKGIIFSLPSENEGGSRQPTIARLPEVIHGLRNLIQNAVDFAASRVWVDAEWTDSEVRVRITDDGRGFPPGVIARIGDPFVRGRSAAPGRGDRPGYEGMGLGLFIAKTLLERTGASVRFANAAETARARPGRRRGAVVEVLWPSDRIVTEASQILGPNPGISA